MIDEYSIGVVQCVFDATPNLEKFDTSAMWIGTAKDIKQCLPELDSFVVGIGGEFGYARNAISEALSKLDLESISLVHAKAYIDRSSDIGYGLQMMPGAIVHKYCRIGNNVILNTGSTVDHECDVGHGVHVMGSAAIAGRVRIGMYATIGTNATVLPDLVIGEGAFVGAGAVVTKSVEPYSVVVGVPARHLKYRDNKAELGVFHDLRKL